MSRIKFLAKSPESTVFNTNCRVNQYHCNLKNSIIVWDKDITSNCQLEIISSTNQMRLNDKTLFSKDEHLALVFSHFETNCNIEMFYTEEGLYGTINSLISNSTMKVKSELDNKALAELILADADFSKLVDSWEIKHMQYIECKLFKLIVSNFMLNDKKYLLTTDKFNKELILYTEGGMLFLPDCIIVDEIIIRNNSEKCFDGIPVNINLNNKTYQVFYKREGFLEKTAKQLYQCPSKHIFELRNSNKIIIYENNTYTVVNKSTMTAYPKIFEFDIKENFQHFKLILDDSSYSKNKDDGPTSLEPFGLIQYTLEDDKIDVFSNIALFEGVVNDIKSIIWKKLQRLFVSHYCWS